MDTQEKLTKARIQLLLDRPFYGTLALHLKLKEEKSIPTACTDGKMILYNKQFIDSLSERDHQWLLTHEILHCVLSHITRRQDREMMRWNLAVDICVNGILKQEFGYIIEGSVYDENLKDLSAEEIYTKLPNMNGKQGNKEGDYKRYEKGKVTIEVDKDGNITYNGKEIKPIDTHKDAEGNKDELDDLEKDWKLESVKAHQQSKMAGKLPAGMDIYITKMLEPKLNWRDMMKQFVISASQSDYAWIPCDRRFIHRDLYLPSVSGEALGEVVVIVDNSGSTLNYQERFFSECNSLLQQYDMNLHLIVVDVEVNFYKVYNKGEEIESKYSGGGGTEIPMAFEYIQKKGIQPNVVVCLTDGYTAFPEKEEYPTLWVVTEDGLDLDRFPFGQKVKVER